MRKKVIERICHGASPDMAARARQLLQTHGTVMSELIAIGFQPASVLAVCVEVTGVEAAPVDWLKNPQPPEHKLDGTLCRQLQAAPVATLSGWLCIAYGDPDTVAQAADLGFPPHQPYLALPAQLERALALLPGGAPRPALAPSIGSAPRPRPPPAPASLDPVMPLPGASPWDGVQTVENVPDAAPLPLPGSAPAVRPKLPPKPAPAMAAFEPLDEPLAAASPPMRSAPPAPAPSAPARPPLPSSSSGPRVRPPFESLDPVLEPGGAIAKPAAPVASKAAKAPDKRAPEKKAPDKKTLEKKKGDAGPRAIHLSSASTSGSRVLPLFFLIAAIAVVAVGVLRPVVWRAPPPASAQVKLGRQQDLVSRASSMQDHARAIGLLDSAVAMDPASRVARVALLERVRRRIALTQFDEARADLALLKARPDAESIAPLIKDAVDRIDRMQPKAKKPPPPPQEKPR